MDDILDDLQNPRFDGCLNSRAADAIARLREAFLSYIQADNACTETGKPCRDPAQCGCHVEMHNAITQPPPRF